VSILGFVGEIYFEDKVVAHFKDGSIVKGHTEDFDPDKDAFTLQPYVGGQKPVPVTLEDLKAVFHVKTFEGNPDHGPSPESVGEVADPRFRGVMERGRKALLEFKDGERMWGFAAGVERPTSGFFFFPTDPESNNLRIYVVRSALKDMVLLGG
jgi:hypothetical protein